MIRDYFMIARASTNDHQPLAMQSRAWNNATTIKPVAADRGKSCRAATGGATTATRITATAPNIPAPTSRRMRHAR